MGLSVIGAGFGRTGTLSLKLALEKVGCGPCYHMLEVFGRPGHAALWSSAADGDDVDWDALFEGFAASVDWPSCHFWRQLADRYPEAGVLLTVRDPERWYDSVMATIYQGMVRPLPSGVPEEIGIQRAMALKIVLDQAFDGRLEDRDYAIAAYQRHNEQVREAFAGSDRLLVYEVAQGWEPLCRFLDRPIPEEDFPHVNDKESFRQRMGLEAE
jgi:hypothetical protein